jgi:hypothetical protein
MWVKRTFLAVNVHVWTVQFATQYQQIQVQNSPTTRVEAGRVARLTHVHREALARCISVHYCIAPDALTHDA